MNKLYPLKFTPIFKDKIWGGQKVRDELGLDFSPLPNCGEVWALSGVKGNQSVVKNGFLADNELNELIEVYMEEIVGDVVFEKHGTEFPILIKFIDSKDWLSIQVHPDDRLAQKRKLGNGKTEMWYILGADKDAELISGFSEKCAQEKYLHHLKNKTLKDILNFEKVNKGDVFFIPAGRVHALGPGILLTEIQQTSDTTYRIFDWDRIQADGSFREIHTEEALDAIDFKLYDEYKVKYQNQENQTANLVQCPYFTTNLLDFDAPIDKDYHEVDSFVVFICNQGEFDIEYAGEKTACKQGDVVLLPAAIKNVGLIPKNRAQLLEVYIV